MMGYDEFGHMVYQKLGNGTETTYAYDRQRQRLQEMNLTASGNALMQNKYEYDKVDNILSLVNNVSPQNLTQQNKAKLGGMSSHSYQYDELNRLISAQGKAKSASYDMAMTFNSMSMPISKAQTVDSTTTTTSYHNIYRYEDSSHPTAPTQIGHEHYEYDANGNPTLVTNDSLNTTRELYWDEDNRLMILSDNGRTSRYTYNHAGERIVKSHGDLEGVYSNGAPQGITFHEHDDFTIYPASIISINKNRFTKHYFIGSQRIASKLGSGRFNNVYGRNGSYITAGQQDYAERLNQIESQREEYYKELGIPPGVPTMKGAYGDPENTGIGYNTIITELGDHSVPANWAQYVVKREPGETPGPPIIWSDPQDPEDAQPGYGFIADDTTEEETFFYHSDHLGSTSYITDQDGNITQYTAYLPYGELLVDEHSSSEDLPYKFNGKELDEETGLYYYGARYMNPVASIWYGVDPLTEKYPSLSAYVYCAGNPVKLIDPNGMAWEPTKNKQTNEVTGYKWIQPKDSYDRNGNLLPGLYEQAIFFSNAGSDGKKYDSNSKYNIGTSTAYVYKSDGTVALFNACTNPSDINKYPSVPAGSYEAMVGKHKGQYSALRMSDVGTQNFYNNSIELGEPNLAHPNKTTANGINIHKPGLNNLTGMTSKGTAVSEGCFLIDRNQWGTFMECFQPNVRIGIAVSRTMAVPTNKNTDNSLFKSNKLLYQPITMPLDALRVVKPLMR